MLLAAVSGALRHYLQEHGSGVGEIQAMVPFNLRSLDDPLPRELGNKFGLVFLPLPVGTSGSYRRLTRGPPADEDDQGQAATARSHTGC